MRDIAHLQEYLRQTLWEPWHKQFHALGLHNQQLFLLCVLHINTNAYFPWGAWTPRYKSWSVRAQRWIFCSAHFQPGVLPVSPLSPGPPTCACPTQTPLQPPSAIRSLASYRAYLPHTYHRVKLTRQVTLQARGTLQFTD